MQFGFDDFQKRNIKKVRSKLSAMDNYAISNQFINKGIEKHGIDYMLWIANYSNSRNDIRHMIKGIHGDKLYEYTGTEEIVL